MSVAFDGDVEAAVSRVVVPPGLRRAGPDDDVALHALVRAHDLKYVGRERQAIDEVRLDVERPGSVHWMRETPDGQADLWVGALAMPGVEHIFAWVMYAGEDVDDAFGQQLVELAVAGGRALDPTREVHVGAGAKEADVTRWILTAGGTEARRFGRMEIELDPTGRHARPPAPPAGVTLRTAQDTDADWHVLYDVIEIAFRDHYAHVPQSYEQYVAEDRPWVDDYSVVWIASVDGTPAAALIGKLKPTEGYVGTLGTLRQYRGRGLATFLLNVSFAEFARRGHRIGALHVDLTNPTGAVRVYESAGMHLADYEVDYRFPSAAALAGP